MKYFYKILGSMALFSGICGEILVIIAVAQNQPEQIRVLRSIQCGIWFLVAIVAFGNADKVEQK